jgi:hypothetical protein
MRRFVFVLTLLSLIGISAQRASAVEVAAKRALNVTLPDLRFDNVTLNDAIDFLRDVTGVNIHVNWRAMELIGVGKDTTINVRLRVVTLRKVLRTILSEAGTGNLLTFYIDENVIEVTTRELADRQLFTRVYPVEDLIMEVPDFDQAPTFQLNTASTGGRGSGGGGGQGIFNNTNNQTNTGPNRTDRSQELIDTIQAIVQPDIWNTAGGPAAIRFWNGSLIVTAPRSVHEALGGYFD